MGDGGHGEKTLALVPREELADLVVGERGLVAGVAAIGAAITFRPTHLTQQPG